MRFGQKKPNKSVQPKAEPRVIDFTSTTWGHNFSVSPSDGYGKHSGFVWCTPGPRLGDLVHWETNYGVAVLEVIYSEWTTNVSDMYKVELKVVDRIIDEEKVNGSTR